MRVLAITNLFPNARQPNRGVFNLQQFAALRRLCELRVVAPLPWQPWAHGFSRPVPYEEEWHGIPTLRPLYIYTPRVGRAAYALWMYLSLRRAVTRLAREYRPDVLLGTWVYPDGVATALFAKELNLPWVAKVHGSDIHVHTNAPAVRGQIRWALRRAACTFAVSLPMKERLVRLGVPEAAVRVQLNGVALDRFAPMDRAAAKVALSLPPERPLLLYVGNLEAIKGVTDLVEAARLLTSPRRPVAPLPRRRAERALLFVLVGDGRLRTELQERIRRHALDDHVLLAGAQPHGEIPLWNAACDVLCLPSHHEGCPNVVLEAMACGRPVVATRVGAVPDLIDEDSGLLVPPCQPERLAEAIRAACERDWNPLAIRERVLPLSWEANAANLMAALQAACGVRLEAGRAETQPLDPPSVVR